MSKRPKQIVSALGSADEDRLIEQRLVVEKLIAANPETPSKLRTAAGKLGAIRAILEAQIFEPHQSYELQCLGVVLGDAFVSELGMEWVMVEDEYGRDPAVRLPSTGALIFPLTMISKRVERGESVDVFELFDWVAAKIEELEADGR